MTRRPAAAHAAVDRYANLVRGEQAEPIDTQIVDLLADLFHLAHDHGFDPEALYDTAELHYLAEQAEATDV